MRHIIVSVVLAASAAGTSFSQTVPNLYPKGADAAHMEQWVDSVFDAMTLEERVGQLFMPIIDMRDNARNNELLRSYVEDLHVGGVLFSKGTSVRQANVTNRLQSLAKVPLMVSLDGEWGLAMRLTDAPRFPRNMMLGAVASDSLIEAYGREVGRQCREMGIHVNFAPVLDANSNPDNPVINTRSFGEQTDLVSRKANAYARGLESQGVLAVGKHFPGHGDTSTDSHLTLPYVKHPLERIESYELAPFRSFINEGYGGMMVGHLAVAALDSTNTPASLSPLIVDGKLKREMGFEGLVFTDGLAMKGVSSEPDMCIRALEAGNDILLGTTNTAREVKNLITAVEESAIPMSLIEEKVLKILRYKYIAGLASPQAPINASVMPARLNTPATEVLNRRLHAEAITVLKNNDNILPLTRLDEKQVAVVSIGGNACGGSFAETINRYDAVTTAICASSKEVAAVRSKTSGSNLLIVAITSGKAADVDMARAICKGKRYILAFFTSPYVMSNYKSLIDDAEAVVLGYEASELAGETTAEVIYGGIGARGSLSVSVPGLYEVGAGLRTTQTRLGFRQPEEAGLSSATLRGIESIVGEGLKKKAFPGCQIVVAKGGNVVYNRTFGALDYASGTPVDEDDIYDLASVTKATATLSALMLMRDAKLININDALAQHIPALKAVADKKMLTVREALLHETGLPSGYPFYQMAIDTDALGAPLFSGTRSDTYSLQVDKNYYANKNYRYRTGLTSDERADDCSLPVARGLYIVPAFRDSIAEKIYSLPLKNRGGYRYSDLNFVLLRMAVENASGKPINELVEADVFRPLGAKRLMYLPAERYDSAKIAPTEQDDFLRKQLLRGYVHDETAAFAGGVEGNAGLFGNALDLAKLAQLWLNEGEYGGERYFTPETVKLFTGTKSPKSRRGLGFDKPDVSNPRLSPTCQQAPASTYGHTGFTGPCFWIDPDNELVYIFVTNRVNPHRWNKQLTADNYRTRIQEVIYESLNK